MELRNINAIEWIRSRPNQFFASGKPDAVALLAYLMADVVMIGLGTCFIRRTSADWWIIASDSDWLKNGKYSIQELFYHVVSEHSHGEHSMRGEVLLSAFAKSVSIISFGHLINIFGDVPCDKTLKSIVDFPHAIIFRVE